MRGRLLSQIEPPGRVLATRYMRTVAGSSQYTTGRLDANSCPRSGFCQPTTHGPLYRFQARQIVANVWRVSGCHYAEQLRHQQRRQQLSYRSPRCLSGLLSTTVQQQPEALRHRAVCCQGSGYDCWKEWQAPGTKQEHQLTVSIEKSILPGSVQ